MNYFQFRLYIFVYVIVICPIFHVFGHENLNYEKSSGRLIAHGKRGKNILFITEDDIRSSIKLINSAPIYGATVGHRPPLEMEGPTRPQRGLKTLHLSLNC